MWELAPEHLAVRSALSVIGLNNTLMNVGSPIGHRAPRPTLIPWTAQLLDTAPTRVFFLAVPTGFEPVSPP